jgi:acid phosphatase family membrane protein YuiD
MSSASFAYLRKTQGDELARLAEEHYKHDLQDVDKQTLKNAASKFSTSALVGSIVGIGLGAYLAFRVRANR